MKNFVGVFVLLLLSLLSVKVAGLDTSTETVTIPKSIWLQLTLNSPVLSKETSILSKSFAEVRQESANLKISNDNLLIINSNLSESLNLERSTSADLRVQNEMEVLRSEELKSMLLSTQNSLDLATSSLKTEKSKAMWKGVGIGFGSATVVAVIVAIVKQVQSGGK